VLGEQHSGTATEMARAHGAASTVYGDLGQGVLAILAVLLALVTLLVVVAYLEPRKPLAGRTAALDRREQPRRTVPYTAATLGAEEDWT
jgi:hypothetical protein